MVPMENLLELLLQNFTKYDTFPIAHTAVSKQCRKSTKYHDYIHIYDLADLQITLVNTFLVFDLLCVITVLICVSFRVNVGHFVSCCSHQKLFCCIYKLNIRIMLFT